MMQKSGPYKIPYDHRTHPDVMQAAPLYLRACHAPSTYNSLHMQVHVAAITRN